LLRWSPGLSGVGNIIRDTGSEVEGGTAYLKSCAAAKGKKYEIGVKQGEGGREGGGGGGGDMKLPRRD